MTPTSSSHRGNICLTKSLMAQSLSQSSIMKFAVHDLSVMGSNPNWVQFGGDWSFCLNLTNETN